VGKFYIFASLIKEGDAFYYLVFIGGINSVVSLYYYLRVVRVMYFSGVRQDVITKPGTIMGTMLFLTALPTLILGIYWVPLTTWVENSLKFFIQTL
jgi:NADH-quinone oxidoreductase subunit N